MLCQVETQGNQMELLRQKNKVLLEENRQLQQLVESLERSVTTLPSLSHVSPSAPPSTSLKTSGPDYTAHLSFIDLQVFLPPI